MLNPASTSDVLRLVTGAAVVQSDAATVSQLVIGGQAGMTYLLSCLAVTDGGTAGIPQTLYAEALCPVF